MVVAGPGTGKTEVVSMRVANILQKTQMRPGNILCLTFSKSGATAMRKRLRDIIGSDAYGVTVDTLHGFANSIISQHPHVFEDWSALEQISDVERYRSLNKIIDQQMPETTLVNKKSPYSRSRDILGRISQLKREGVTDREELLSIAQQYESVMAGKSREGTKVHEKNLLAAKKFRDFLEVFFQYQEMLSKTGRYDYDDMILHVISALQTEDWMLAGLQERYQYILVDEFQDTNGAQNKFVEILTKDPTGNENPNLFIVGDDDQAIYRFQGANLSNILSFRERFPKAPVIPLETSYRCTQPILDAADALISQNTERLVGRIPGLQKKLVSSVPQVGNAPTLLLSPSDMSEPWMIADIVQERLNADVAPNDIAILVQTNRELPALYDVLSSRNIPVQMSGKIDLLSHPLVRQAITILRAVHHPGESGLLAAALACQCFECRPADLAKLFSLRREERTSLQETLLRVDELNIQLSNPDSIIYARDTLLDLHQKLASRTVVHTLEHTLKDCNLLASYEGGAMDIIDFAAVQEFFDRIKQRAYEQHSFNFEVFLSDLEFYDNDDYGDLRLSYDLPHLTQEGVQLMTAHKSKGLEFHTVIIPNFREGHWDRRRNPPSLSVPEDLLFGWEKDQKSFEQNQDERRVAFVAITRAKRELIFSCPEELTAGDSLRAVSPSGFFAESGDLPEEKREVLDPEHMSTLLAEPEREFDEETKAYLLQRLEHFSLSPTALNDFLADPQIFVARHLLLMPQAKEAHFAYGNAVHHVLAHWGLSLQEGTPLTKEQILSGFSSHLQDKELLPEQDFIRLESLGHETLRRYFDEHLQEPYPIVHKVEYDVSAHLGDIPLKGKLDRIDLLEPNSTSAIVYDYKTGKPKAPKQILDYGYHRQLVFYALLIEHSSLLLDPKEFVLEFVGEGSEHAVRRTYTISQEEKKELAELIEKVWAKILALDFTPLGE
jgi:DNA helicase-2/ATP-dependent DNA helicase PcrA